MPESERPTPASRPRTRRHETRWSVQLADHVSSLVITVGGIGTIVAVCLVFVLLLSVVLPLFHRAEVSSVTSTKLPEISAAQATLHAGVDEYRLIAWTVTPDGLVRSFRTDTGELLNEVRLTDAEHPLTAFSFQSEHGDFVAARENGTLQLGTIQFESRFLSPADLPDTIRNLDAQQIATHGQSVVQVTSQGQYREQALQVTLGEVVDLKGETLQHLSHTTASTGKIVVGINQAGQVLAAKLREKKNVLTRKVTWTVRVDMLPSPEISQPADRVLLTERGDNAFILNQRGELVRYMLNGESPQIAESLCVFPADDCLPSEQTADRAVVTSAAFALGGETLLIGDSHGGLRAWFTVRNRHAQTPDERWLLPVHELPQGAAAVTSLGISERSRMVAVGYADGELDVVHLTNDAKVLRVNAGQQPVDTVIMTPKDDGLLALAGNSLWQCELDPGYPEASFSSFFQPIWYEGYDRPEHVWQSSFAGVSSEMKLGLVPLIFGTMKATLYSLLFGVPIALLGAIYTSEFLSPRYRNRIKPLIETMASLPSVVLGFMGGLVIALIVEQHVSSILVSFVFLPLSCLLGSFLWQHLPQRQAFRLANYRLFFVTLVLTAGGLASWRMGPIVESWFFAGDIMLWLDQQHGIATGAWFFLLLPLAAFASTLLISTYVNPWLTEYVAHVSRFRAANFNLLKFLAGIAAAAAFAWIGGATLTSLGLDPRGSVVGTYVQRNALVVGFVMGFAIIPIIYTIAEDSLSTVPRHLRSASLGAGATRLQTALRVVVPTAMSGLFSAVMIGLGRAVGETMIVLMAAGNTPITDWNLFNGFRTLSANIAVELPEAVRNSTHYRTLFLAALTLLMLTFVINTVAEWVRLRFRRRAVQL